MQVVTEQAWHSLFADAFHPPGHRRGGCQARRAHTPFKKDWTILNAGRMRLTGEQQAKLGYKGPCSSRVSNGIVLIIGSEYAGG